MNISDVRIIELPKFLDARGNLSFAENFAQIPFEIKRTYWLYDVPGGVNRGGHAEINNEEVVIAMSGAFDIVVDDGVQSKTFTLNRSYYGLYIPKGLWREIKEFSTNAIALEFGSIPYDVNDYIRNYDAFLAYSKSVSEKKIEPIQSPLLEKTKIEHKQYNVFDCTMVELDKHHSDRKGNLTVVENGKTLPFDVKRVYYLYDIPGGESRGAHAHKELEQLIIAASGSFTVTLDDGNCKRSFFLNRPYQGLYVKPGIWRDLDDFSAGAVCMVLASDVYNAEDYIRSYDDFVSFRHTDSTDITENN
jgi:dTDP-4-dehydrorhamnose 3,5-epimerase-like enzyme